MAVDNCKELRHTPMLSLLIELDGQFHVGYISSTRKVTDMDITVGEVEEYTFSMLTCA